MHRDPIAFVIGFILGMILVYLITGNVFAKHKNRRYLFKCEFKANLNTAVNQIV